MRPQAILVDLGGTLVDFFGHLHSEQLVPPSLRSAADRLEAAGGEVPPQPVLLARWSAIRRDPRDLRAKPLEDRLAFIFDLAPGDGEGMETACRGFMRPLFGNARVFEDAIPFLSAVREEGLRTVLVSNTTWGSPSQLWREELQRLRMDRLLDDTVFCRDVGWRKPDPRIFERALSLAEAPPSECLFVGDDPDWDVRGPRSMGIPALLLDRRMEWVGQGFDRVTNLREIVDGELLGRGHFRP